MGVFITNVFSASVNRTVSKFHACELGVNGLERRVRTCTSASMGKSTLQLEILDGLQKSSLTRGLLGHHSLCRLPGEQETGLPFTLSSTGHSAIAFSLWLWPHTRTRIPDSKSSQSRSVGEHLILVTGQPQFPIMNKNIQNLSGQWG